MMKIYYENSQGVQLDLLKSPYRLQTGNIFDYKWSYSHRATVRKTAKIKGFSKDLEEKNLLLSILNYGKQAYYNAINFFAQTTEFDVVNNSPGKLYVGDMYLRCFIIASEKTEWESGIELLDNEITLVIDYPFWIKEHPYYFKTSDITSVNNKRYANKYAYRYANGLNNTYLINEHYEECNFRMNIYGPCVKPSVYIGGYEYHVDAILEAGERLEIDSAAETVTKVMNSGKRVNMFHYRSFGSTLFQPIQTGMQNIFWDGKFDFDIILFEERSEPKWS